VKLTADEWFERGERLFPPEDEERTGIDMSNPKVVENPPELKGVFG